jgi:hypothetical protein
MAKPLRLALIIVEVSSIPLLLLTVLYVLSGYQLLYPYIRLIPASRAIHVDLLLRILFIILTYLHSLAGLVILLERRVKLKILKLVLEYIVIIGLSLFLALCLTLDIAFR